MGACFDDDRKGSSRQDDLESDESPKSLRSLLSLTLLISVSLLEAKDPAATTLVAFWSA